MLEIRAPFVLMGRDLFNPTRKTTP